MKKIKYIVLFVTLLGAFVIYFCTIHRCKYKPTEQLDLDNDKILNLNDLDVDGDGIDNLLDIDADNDGIDNINDIVNNARQLKWTVYDYLKGKYNNFGGRLGFIVCIDVPRIAYANAGIYFENLLHEDYKKNTQNYRTKKDNTPATKFFFRRVRNLYDYCEGNNRLIKNCMKPKIGDLVFYNRYHVALVSEVHSDGTYN